MEKTKAKKIIATVECTDNGREIWFEDDSINLHETYSEQNDDDDGIDEDGEESEHFLKEIERLTVEFLTKHNITHIVDFEFYGDDKARPVAKYLKAARDERDEE